MNIGPHEEDRVIAEASARFDRGTDRGGPDALIREGQQLYENRLLRLGSPLFHYGILLVILGHVGGLLIPKSWTEAVGIGQHA
ncbi:respiratory nitrate reductase subunit gamma, partial [Nocardia asiatica]|uniref:respiratory nitrate reductase subunit gamma n=1 Tax=Nocardia asiatica TaxID=209252 RepID=UPI002453C30D